MIICTGEILVDMVGRMNNGILQYDRHAGGAPFNVCSAIAKFGGESIFNGAVGNDLMGSFLIDFSSRQNIRKVYLNIDLKHNTTLAFVDIDENGERNFCFYRKHTADYHLEPIKEVDLKNANIVHFGSLMLSEEEGFEFAQKEMERAKELGKYISFDVNFRTDIFKNEKEALDRYKTILKYVDIVKFSEEEVNIFGKTYVKNLSQHALVCVSLGNKGSKYIYKGLTNKIPSIKVKPIDTTGAGDAFFAAILMNLDGVNSNEWNKELLDKIFKFANIAGALTTLKVGAIDSLPSSEEIKKYY